MGVRLQTQRRFFTKRSKIKTLPPRAVAFWPPTRSRRLRYEIAGIRQLAYLGEKSVGERPVTITHQTRLLARTMEAKRSLFHQIPQSLVNLVELPFPEAETLSDVTRPITDHATRLVSFEAIENLGHICPGLLARLLCYCES